MTDHQQAFGSYVTDALAAYDEWIGSDADDDSFRDLEVAMDLLRHAVASLIDKEIAK